MQPGSLAEWFSGGATAAAVIVALGGYGYGELQRRRDRKDRERSAGRQIGIKLFRIMNATDDIRRHLCAPSNNAAPPPKALWLIIQPLIGLELEPDLMLGAAESDLLLKMNATDFLMRQILVTLRYQSIVRGMQEYAVRYDVTYQMLPAPSAMVGALGQHHLTEEQNLKIQPYSLQLDALLHSLRDMAVENVGQCEKLSKEYNPLMKAYFKEKFLGMKMPD